MKLHFESNLDYQHAAIELNIKIKTTVAPARYQTIFIAQNTLVKSAL